MRRLKPEGRAERAAMMERLKVGDKVWMNSSTIVKLGEVAGITPKQVLCTNGVYYRKGDGSGVGWQSRSIASIATAEEVEKWELDLAAAEIARAQWVAQRAELNELMAPIAGEDRYCDPVYGNCISSFHFNGSQFTYEEMKAMIGALAKMREVKA